MKRNSKGQFIGQETVDTDNKQDIISFKLPDITKVLLNILLIIFFLPWLYIFIFRLDLKLYLINMGNMLFGCQPCLRNCTIGANKDKTDF